MKAYVQIMQAKRVGVKVRTSSRDKEHPELVKRYRSKQGAESLIFDPVIGIQFTLYTPDMQPGTYITFDISMAPHVAKRIKDVYNAILEDTKIYIKDENGVVTLDRERAIKEYGRKISSFAEYLEIYPGIDYDNPGEKCIILQVGNIASPLPLYRAERLIDMLERVDVMTYSAMLGVMDQVAEVDQTTKRIEKKVDKLLAINSGSSRPPISSPTPVGNNVSAFRPIDKPAATGTTQSSPAIDWTPESQGFDDIY